MTRKENDMVAGEGKKESEILGGPVEGVLGRGVLGRVVPSGGEERGPKILKTPTKNLEDTHQKS